MRKFDATSTINLNRSDISDISAPIQTLKLDDNAEIEKGGAI